MDILISRAAVSLSPSALPFQELVCVGRHSSLSLSRSTAPTQCSCLMEMLPLVALGRLLAPFCFQSCLFTLKLFYHRRPAPVNRSRHKRLDGLGKLTGTWPTQTAPPTGCPEWLHLCCPAFWMLVGAVHQVAPPGI